MPKKYEPEFKARAVRLVRDHMSDYGSVTAASVAVGGQLGVARETLHRWVAQAEVDDGARSGVTTGADGLGVVVQRQVDSRRVAARPLHQGGGRRATVRPGDQVAPPVPGHGRSATSAGRALIKIRSADLRSAVRCGRVRAPDRSAGARVIVQVTG